MEAADEEPAQICTYSRIRQLHNHVFALSSQSRRRRRRQLQANGDWDGEFVVINMNWRLAASDSSAHTDTLSGGHNGADCVCELEGGREGSVCENRFVKNAENGKK